MIPLPPVGAAGWQQCDHIAPAGGFSIMATIESTPNRIEILADRVQIGPQIDGYIVMDDDVDLAEELQRNFALHPSKNKSLLITRPCRVIFEFVD